MLVWLSEYATKSTGTPLLNCTTINDTTIDIYLRDSSSETFRLEHFHFHSAQSSGAKCGFS
jgi:hypothetical protein